eukprot:165679-Pleurochrysis_carterae.AAC.1
MLIKHAQQGKSTIPGRRYMLITTAALLQGYPCRPRGRRPITKEHHQETRGFMRVRDVHQMSAFRLIRVVEGRGSPLQAE